MRDSRLFIVVVLSLVLLGSGCAKVRNDEGGVVTSYILFKGIRPKPRGPGLYISIPSVWEVAKYKVSQQKYEMTKHPDAGDTPGRDDVQVKSRDGQIVWVDTTIRYRLIFEKLPILHREFGNNYISAAIRPMARALTAYKFGALSAEEIYEGTNREQVGLEIRRMMNDGYEGVQGLRDRGIEIEDVLFRSFEFTEEYQTAIEQKRLAAEQRLAAIELAKKLEAEADGQKMAAIKRAEGEAAAIKAKADADLYRKQMNARGIEAEGMAEAKAKKALAEAMGGGQYIVALEFARNLSDKLEIWGIPTGQQSTSIMDLNGLFGRMFPRPMFPAQGMNPPPALGGGASSATEGHDPASEVGVNPAGPESAREAAGP